MYDEGTWEEYIADPPAPAPEEGEVDDAGVGSGMPERPRPDEYCK